MEDRQRKQHSVIRQCDAPPPLMIYNTMSRMKERFEPVTSGIVHMYVCGPTVYDRIHIGNARPLIFFDVVRRYLAQFYQVQYVVNITDVDDKIIRRAQQLSLSMQEVARNNIDAFMEDMRALCVREADHHPRVTEHIQDIIAFIQQLIERQCAYVIEGDVYFRVAAFPAYGKLVHLRTQALQHGIRVVLDERKEHPADFALWKVAKPGEVAWEAPWGAGRPGWHIECSTMARTYLGDTIDIHGGGADLQFPHHECEIAQSESLTGKTYVRYWMHNAFIQRNDEKMSKSLGNVVSVQTLLQEHRPEALRYLILATHYRNPLQLTDESLRHAHHAVTRFGQAVQLLQEAWCDGEQPTPTAIAEAMDTERGRRLQRIIRSFHEKMCDDWNTPDVLTVWFELVNETHSVLGDRAQEAATMVWLLLETFSFFDDVLGLLPSTDTRQLDQHIEAWIAERQAARAARDFARADAIRERLLQEGILLEDTPNGVRWRRR